MLNWVAHQIKSPLSAALTVAQLARRGLRTGETPEQTTQRLRTMENQLHRLDDLVNSILDAARLGDGRLDLELQRVDADPWLTPIVATWRETHPELPISLEVEAGVVLWIDPERLRQVVDPANGIQVRLLKEGGSALISVWDRGAGIPPDQLPHVFDRFHRVAGQGGRGHGLGLYIASALTRLHGGELSAQSEPGVGSCFTIRVPLPIGPG
jgi:two-component system sensor histidine kinase/response regulator